MVKICFDYGHGGLDPGATFKGRRESQDNLELGRRVADKLALYKIEVGETRTRDLNLSLRQRVDFANRAGYDYFISFHRNAFKPEMANGAEVFVHPQGSPKAKILAEEIQRGLVACGFRNRGVKSSNFYVLRKTKMPGLLIEVGFIDNSGDNRIFDENRQMIIDRISKAIISVSL